MKLEIIWNGLELIGIGIAVVGVLLFYFMMWWTDRKRRK